MKRKIGLIITFVFCMTFLQEIYAANLNEITLQSYPQKKSFLLKQYQGKVVLVNFWAPWCIPCRKEFPELDALQKKFETEGLPIQIIGMTAEKKGKKIEKFLKRSPVSFPIFVDPEGELHREASIAAMPTNIILDTKGKLVKTFAGYTKAEGLGKIEKELRKLLQ